MIQSPANSQALNQYLENLASIASNSDVSTFKIMNFRSKLGHTLHLICLSESEELYIEIITAMETYEFDPSLSIILIASYCFSMDFLPIKDKQIFSESSIRQFLKHTTTNDLSFLQSYIKYLTSGGSKKIFFKANLIESYLELVSETILYAKIIGILINDDPLRYSKYFWDFYQKKYEKIDSKITSQISMTIFSCNSLIPTEEFKPFHNKVIEYCKNVVKDTSNSFSIIEENLNIIAYYIKNRMTDPFGIFPIYSQPNLNTLVITCWSHYARYGDLSLIPKFDQPDLKQQNFIFLNLIVESSNNPSFHFDSLSISNQLWDYCLCEFIHEEFDGETRMKFSSTCEPCFQQITKLNESLVPSDTYSFYPSVLNMSIEELNFVVQMTQFLPSWFFIQCMNTRVQNSDICMRILQIIANTPFSLAYEHKEELFEFFDYIIDIPRVETDVIKCINNLFVPCNKLSDLFVQRIVRSCDPFNEENLQNRLPILSDLLEFNVQTHDIIPLFYEILEYFTNYNISLSFLQVLLQFFIAISPYLTDDLSVIQELSYIVQGCFISFYNAINCALSNSNLPIKYVKGLSKTSLFSQIIPATTLESIQLTQIQMPTVFENYPNAAHVFKLCKTYFNVISADIVFNPNYKIMDSYSLMSLSIRLMHRIPPQLFPNLQSILSMFPFLLQFDPVGIASVALQYFDFCLKNNYQDEMFKIGKAIAKQTNFNNDNSFVIIAQKYLDNFSQIHEFEAKQLNESKINDLNDDPATTRVLLKIHPELFPLLVNHEEQLFLLYESNGPTIPDSFFLGLYGRLCGELDQHEERVIRIFLKYFHKKQPPYKKENSWIKRELIDNYQYKKPKLFEFTENEIQKFGLKQTLNYLSYFIPLEISKIGRNLSTNTIPNEYSDALLIQAIKQLKHIPIYIKWLNHLVDLSEKIENDKFWFMKLKLKRGLKFLVQGEYPKAQALRILLNQDNQEEAKVIIHESEDQISFELIPDKDFLFVLKLKQLSSKKSFPLSEQINSQTLESMFLKVHNILPEEKLLELIQNCICISSKINILAYIQFYIQSTTSLSIFDHKGVTSIFHTDPYHPLLFNSVFIAIAAIATMKIDVPDANNIISDFLVSTFKTAKYSSASIYVVLPALKTIFSSTGSLKNGRKVTKQFFKNFPQELVAGTPLEPILLSFLKDLQ